MNGGQGMSGVPAIRASIRSRRRTSTGWLDRYAALFGLAMAAAVLAHPVSSALAAMVRQPDPSRMGAGVALVALAYTGLLAVARVVGPVALTGPDAAWLLLSPLDRREVLGRTARLLLLVSVPVGAALGMGLLAVLGAPDQLAVRLAAAMVLGVSAAAGGMALTVLSQSSQTWNSWLNVALVAITVLAAAAALSASGAARRSLPTVAAAPATPGAVLAGAAAVAAALLLRLAWSSLARIPARSLLAASTRAGHVADATVGMDPGALTWIAEDNHWRGRALRSRPWPPLPAPLALAWQDWRRLGRRPGRPAALLAAAALPPVVAQATGGISAITAGAVLAGALAASVAGTSGARRDADNPGLARLLGVDARAALTARALLPALLSAVWLTLALTGLTLTGMLPGGPWWLFGPLAAPALAAAGLRMARRRPIDHAMPVIETPAGAVPTGPVLWGVTGADLAALGCLPLALALTVGPAALGGFLAAQALAGAAVLCCYLLRAAKSP
ncbi:MULTISPECIES: DUF6297 family protein [Streptosporangium]|uniref:ABC transporter permease n=1 Tax=Streptosporangium brasiliense TaxID=47480 RepID=A0ABT9R2E2_9ACTN|nr:DUF6297 family protein [Streptosporangium brasiliense]MDP9862625.1 hypothetical protein [Streptosporangium brasiliense]